MCGRFVQIIDIDLFVKRFGVMHPVCITVKDNYNVSAGNTAYVITNSRPDKLQPFRFGLTPSWAKKPMYLINARAEGDLNKENKIDYRGELGIIEKPAFKVPLKSKRCLVIANGYYEGPKKERLSKPYHIYRKDKDVFAFAGVWDTWSDEHTGEITNSFSIITTVSNNLTKEIGHDRSPVILNKKDEKRWLDNSLAINELLSLLKPFGNDDFKAEPVSIKVRDPKNKNKDLIIPITPNQATKYNLEVKKKLIRKGMGRNPSKEDPLRQGTLF